MAMNSKEIRDRIQNYLGNGGLFNPEMMDHDKVRDMILDIRDFLDSIKDEPAITYPAQASTPKE